MPAGGDLILLISIIITAIFLDWLWVFKLRKRKKNTPSQVSPPQQVQDSKKTRKKFLEFEFHLRVNLFKKSSEIFIAFPRSSSQEDPVGQPGTSSLDSVPYTFKRFTAVCANFLSRHTWLSLALLLIAVYLSYLGQKGLLIDHVKEPGIWYLLCAGAIIMISPLANDYSGPAPIPFTHVSEFLLPSTILRRRLLILSILIAMANAFLLLARKTGPFYWDIFVLWIASILLFLLPFCPRLQFKRPSIDLKDQWGKILFLVTILWIGFAVRFYQLGLIPYVMENDEGIDGVAALNVLNGNISNMFRTSGGNGTLLYFIMALQVKTFGQTQLALRIGTACVGFITLIAIYFLARKFFGFKIALVSTTLSAVSHLLIQFSRVSPTASSLDPLLGSLSFLLVYSGFQARRTFYLVLAGAVMGLGLYSYVGARVLIFIFAGYLVLLWIFNRQFLRGNGRGVLALGASYLLVAAPMLVWLATNPSSFNARANQMGIFQNGWLAAEITRQNLPIWTILWQQFANAFFIFNFNYPDWFYQAVIPALGPVTGAAFIFGLLASLFRLRDPRFALLNCWFWVTLFLGQVVIVNASSSAYRTLGLMPAVTIMAAVALVRLADGFFHWWPKIRRIAPAVIVSLILIFEAGWNIYNYFGIWNAEVRYSDRISRLASLIGDYMGKQPPGTVVYIAGTVGFHPERWSALEYLRLSTPYEEIEKRFAEVISDIKLGAQTVFIFPPERVKELPDVVNAFPGGKIVQEYFGGNLYFTGYIK